MLLTASEQRFTLGIVHIHTLLFQSYLAVKCYTLVQYKITLPVNCSYASKQAASNSAFGVFTVMKIHISFSLLGLDTML